MLTNHGGDYPYKMTELYDAIFINSSNYKRWITNNLIDSFFPLKDYKEVVQVPDNHHSSLGRVGNIGGVFRTEYLLTKRTAEELALLSKTPKGKILRKWLLDLKDKVEANELLTIEQFYFLIDLVHAFSFVVNQKAIEVTHQQKFIKNYIDNTGRFNLKFAFAQFHDYRNEILNIEPDTISERILRFCDDENRMINPDQSKRKILAILDKYALIGNAAFDFMASIDRPDHISLGVAEKVKGLAQKMNTEIRETNDADLFNEELYLNSVIMQQVNPNIPNSLKIKKRTSELN